MAGLQKLYSTYKENGFTVIVFPCNQFGNEEPGNIDQIVKYYTKNFDVTFPIMAKVEVNGSNEHPLWKWLKSEKKGSQWKKAISWNFAKFLIGRKGNVIRRVDPGIAPKDFESDIMRLLNSDLEGQVV